MKCIRFAREYGVKCRFNYDLSETSILFRGDLPQVSFRFQGFCTDVRGSSDVNG